MARNQDSPGARARLACSRPARRLPGSPPIGGRLSAVWPGAPPAGPRAAALPVLSWGQISRPSGSVQPSAGPQRPRKPGKSLPPTHAPKRGALSACPSAASPPCPLPSPSPPLGGRGRRRADLAAAANGRQRPKPRGPGRALTSGPNCAIILIQPCTVGRSSHVGPNTAHQNAPPQPRAARLPFSAPAAPRA